MVSDGALWPDAVSDVVLALDALFTGVPAEEWDRPAANVGWTCWRTAEHISGVYRGPAAGLI